MAIPDYQTCMLHLLSPTQPYFETLEAAYEKIREELQAGLLDRLKAEAPAILSESSSNSLNVLARQGTAKERMAV
jgi:hypothetical protein